MTTDHIFQVIKDLGAPAALLILGGLGKSLIRRTEDWSNWFMGPDSALAGIGSGVAYAVDDAKSGWTSASADVATAALKHAVWCGGYVFCAFFAYLIVLGLHQAWEGKQVAGADRRRTWMLGGVGNFIGAGVLASLFYLLNHI